MRKIFLSYKAVPELAPLSPTKRIEVLRASGLRFGKTPQHMRVWWLGVVLSLWIPAGVGLVAYLWSEDSGWGVLSFVVVGLLGYSAWFHIHTNCLRPHIRAYLAESDGQRHHTPTRFYWGRAVVALMAMVILPLAVVSIVVERCVSVWTFLPGIIIGALMLGVVYLKVRLRGKVK